MTLKILLRNKIIGLLFLFQMSNVFAGNKVDLILVDSLFLSLNNVNVLLPASGFPYFYNDTIYYMEITNNYQTDSLAIYSFKTDGTFIKKVLLKREKYDTTKKHIELYSLFFWPRGLCINDAEFMVYNLYGDFKVFSKTGIFIRSVVFKNKFNKEFFTIAGTRSQSWHPQYISSKKWILLPITPKGKVFSKKYFLKKGLIGAYDMNGNLVKVFGKWDTIYTQQVMPQLNDFRFHYDEQDEKIYLSQSATPNISVYDLDGKDVGKFGEKGMHLGKFTELHPIKNKDEYRKKQDEYYITEPTYDFVYHDYIHNLTFRTYCPGEAIPDNSDSISKSLNNPIKLKELKVCKIIQGKKEQPYLQIYDNTTNTLIEEMNMRFFVLKQENDIFWVSGGYKYKEDKQGYMIYKYQLIQQ